jgi:hypothetical protein
MCQRSKSVSANVTNRKTCVYAKQLLYHGHTRHDVCHTLHRMLLTRRHQSEIQILYTSEHSQEGKTRVSTTDVFNQ